ncbi:MAG: glycoside hydrolase family 3 protein [Eubacteriales bacterium]|nr:glycoside hydrolase family 3 protein [Eubacteriales bacterium]
MTLREKIGQRLVGGFPGKTMSPEFIRMVRQYKIANVILFQHNVESCSQLKRLCDDIHRLVRQETGHGAFITIDQEGGGVTRLPGDAVNVAGAMALAATGKPENAYTAARITAGELRALGINFNLAPVADVNSNPDNPIIGLRSYGDTPQQVEAYALEALRGYLDGGVLASAKHFPGHGDTALDTHVSLPVIDKSLAELEQLELRPFRALIEAGCPAVMTTHILFPQLEPDGVPGTMSRRIITGLLRQRLGFGGLVVSDDMEMDAIGKYFGTARGVAAAIAAGVDLVFVSHSVERLEESFLEVEKRVLDGTISMEEMDESVARILRFRQRCCLPPEGTAGSPQSFRQSRKLRTDSICLVRGRVPAMGERPLFIGCADYRAGLVSSRETNSTTFAGFMKARFGGDALVTAKDPTGEEVAAAAAMAEGHSSIFLNTYNGHLFPGQLALMKALAQLHIPMAVTALRNPYDLRSLPEGVCGLAAWDYSMETLECLLPILAGEAEARGHLPVSLGGGV